METFESFIRNNRIVVCGYCYNVDEKDIYNVLEMYLKFENIYFVSTELEGRNNINYKQLRFYRNEGAVFVYKNIKVFLESKQNTLEKNYHIILSTFGIRDYHFDEIEKIYNKTKVVWLTFTECKVEFEEELIKSSNPSKKLTLNINTNPHKKHFVLCKDCDKLDTSGLEEFYTERSSEDNRRRLNRRRNGVLISDRIFSNELESLLPNTKEMEFVVPEDVDMLHIIGNESYISNVILEVMKRRKIKNSLEKVKIVFYVDEEDVDGYEKRKRVMDEMITNYKFLEGRREVQLVGDSLFV